MSGSVPVEFDSTSVGVTISPDGPPDFAWDSITSGSLSTRFPLRDRSSLGNA